MVTWARLAVINRPKEGEMSPYPQDFRGHWENTKEFYVFNTHFFNRKDQSLARLNASKLVRERILQLDRFGEWRDERPVFLMGDFNCRPGSPPYNTFIGETGAEEPMIMHDASNTHNEIDWILYKGSVRVLHYEEIDYNRNGVYPSDHNPIYVDFEFIERGSFSADIHH